MKLSFVSGRRRVLQATAVLPFCFPIVALLSLALEVALAFDAGSAARHTMFHRVRRDHSNNNNMSNDSNSETPHHHHHHHVPSQYIVHDNEKWRLCAGAAVLNSQNQLLVGQGLHTLDAWQCPQGGVDEAWQDKPKKETIVEAACRELYEERGLQVNQHVVVVPIDNNNNNKNNNNVKHCK